MTCLSGGEEEEEMEIEEKERGTEEVGTVKEERETRGVELEEGELEVEEHQERGLMLGDVDLNGIQPSHCHHPHVLMRDKEMKLGVVAKELNEAT